jgi:hypothetical protein
MARPMTMPWRVLIAATLVAGCSSKSTAPPQLFTANGTANGEIPLQELKALRCVSARGPVTVEGEGLGVVRWSLSRSATAPTQAQANAALAEIVPTWSVAGDTLVLDVAASSIAGTYSYGAVTLGIPFQMDCVVEDAKGPVRVSSLLNLLKVRGQDAVSVEQHTGSCDVVVTQGELRLDVALPETGTCTGETGVGNITLRLPQSASAALIARTHDGSVSVTGLTLAGRVDSAGFVSGTLGSGTAPVRVETRHGDIWVSALPWP